MDNPNGAYGIAVSTPEGMTTDNKFYNNSGITVNGDVNITVSGNKKLLMYWKTVQDFLWTVIMPK